MAEFMFRLEKKDNTFSRDCMTFVYVYVVNRKVN